MKKTGDLLSTLVAFRIKIQLSILPLPETCCQHLFQSNPNKMGTKMEDTSTYLAFANCIITPFTKMVQTVTATSLHCSTCKILLNGLSF